MNSKCGVQSKRRCESLEPLHFAACIGILIFVLYMIVLTQGVCLPGFTFTGNFQYFTGKDQHLPKISNWSDVLAVKSVILLDQFFWCFFPSKTTTCSTDEIDRVHIFYILKNNKSICKVQNLVHRYYSKHIHTHACTPPHTHTHMHACAHVYTHTQRTHTYRVTHVLAHTHTHTQ